MPRPTPNAPPTLVDEARAAILACRAAYRSVLSALDVDPADGPAAVARALETDVKLAWKLVHLTSADAADPLAVGRFVPGPRAAGRLLDQLTDAGLPPAARRRVEDTTLAFQRLVRRHAGDRASFDLLLDGAVGTGSSATELEQRRAATRSNGYLFGLRAALQVKTVVMAAGARDPDRIDAAIVSGFAGLERVRDHVPWRLIEGHSIDDRGVVRRGRAAVPLDPRVAAGEAPLLLDFCEPRPPSLTAVGRIGDALEFALSPVEPRRRRRETCLVGELFRSLEPRYRTAEHLENAALMSLRTPCDEAVLDVLLERGLLGAEPRYTPSLFSALFTGRHPGPFLDQDRLAVDEEVVGPLPLEAATLEALPRYPAVLEQVFGRTGWDPSRFELHRIRIPHPIVPTDLAIGTPLPEGP